MTCEYVRGYIHINIERRETKPPRKLTVYNHKTDEIYNENNIQTVIKPILKSKSRPRYFSGVCSKTSTRILFNKVLNSLHRSHGTMYTQSNL